jgi:hypothetical protein
MTSDHLYQHGLEREENIRIGKNEHISAFPGRYSREILSRFDDDGVIKPGTQIQQGDPLILAIKERERSQDRVHAGHDKSFSDQSELWDHHEPGTVTDVARTANGVRVAVKSTARLQEGDKISGRMGDKGLVARIYPDAQMPHDKDGRPFEVLINPLGLLTRTNAGQVMEAGLGKIAEKTGKPVVIDDFDKIKDLAGHTQRELDRHGLSDTETITDPMTGRQIPNVLTGNRFFMKLHHTSASKGQGRGIGGYSADGTPSKSGDGAAKRLALMDTNAILSHGATSVIRDGRSIRGQDQPEYWSQFMSGHTPPPAKVPFVHEKFVNTLKAGGINVIRDGQKMQFMALTDKDVDSLAGDRELRNADTVDATKGMKPIAGGLFDPTLTGSHGGKQWSAISLAEPMLNPVMEDPARRILNLTEGKFRDVIAGKAEINGQTGTRAIQSALASIDLPKALAQARQDFGSQRKTLRDDAAKRLKYLKSTEKLGIHPGDWMLKRAPVLPPAFRPVSIMQGWPTPTISIASSLTPTPT